MQSNVAPPVWTIRRGNWFLRLFLWAWQADPKKLNICRMFWGTLFLPLAVFRRESVVTVTTRLVEVVMVLGAFASWVASFAFVALSVAAPFGFVVWVWDAGSLVAVAFCLFVFVGISSAMRPYYEEIWTQIGCWEEKFPGYFILPFAWAPAKVGSGIVWVYRRVFPDLPYYYREWPPMRPTRPAEEVRIRGPWDVFLAFYHGLKHKYCPLVKVI